MKRASLLLLVFLAARFDVLGQGQVNFDNLVVGAPIFGQNFEGLGSYGGKAQLYLVDGANITALEPVTGFLGASGEAAKYVQAVTVVVPGRDSGASATLRVRVWVGGPNYNASPFRGESNDVTVTLGGGTTVPPNLEGLESFAIMIPEPSTVSLAVILFPFIFFGRKLIWR